MADSAFVKVAVPAPLFGLFDYRLPEHLGRAARIGSRVRVPFGRQSVVGLIMGFSACSDVPAAKLKAVQQLLDETPLLDDSLLQLLNWSADYYQHPIGDVVATALPRLLRQGETPQVRGEQAWQLTELGETGGEQACSRAPRQAALLRLLQQAGHRLSSTQLNELSENWRPAMQALAKKALVECIELPCLELASVERINGPQLNDEQQSAVSEVAARLDHYQAFLLQGITGSGKTEVYLSLAQQLIDENRQVLILVPEISLTPQLTQRFQQRLHTPIAALHSGLNDRQRLCAWSMVASGRALVVIGTRSALFTPMPRLGLIIVDEEHDNSLKQQDGFRYNARDLALVRARNAGVPILLGSATPSLESLHNARRGLYRLLRLRQRAAIATPPRIHLLDVRRRPMEDGLSDILLQQIGQHLERQGQVLLFLN
ncbi:MAG TPA: primosomal protein N', partial [Pseudomonadales bacterium]